MAGCLPRHDTITCHINSSCKTVLMFNTNSSHVLIVCVVQYLLTFNMVSPVLFIDVSSSNCLSLKLRLCKLILHPITWPQVVPQDQLIRSFYTS